jgi:hypothetical protein
VVCNCDLVLNPVSPLLNAMPLELALLDVEATVGPLVSQIKSVGVIAYAYSACSLLLVKFKLRAF